MQLIFPVLSLLIVLLFPVLSFPASLPDLTIDEITLDSNNFLVVKFSNLGDTTVPAGKGSLMIYIDGKGLGGYAFNNLADQSFRNPGGSISIRTNFRLSGTNRRIGVMIDPQNEIPEENEFQNTLTRTLTPPVLQGPDITIKNIAIGSGNKLYFTLTNIGNKDTVSGLELKVRVIVNEVVKSDFVYKPPVLKAGGANFDNVFVKPSLVINMTSKVRILVNTYNALDELDSTNNMLERVLPSVSISKYNSLLTNPKIKAVMVWQDSSGSHAYDSWTAAMKNDLNNYLKIYEEGLHLLYSEPPSLSDGNYMSPTDARKIYIAHVAQSLWVDVNNKVTWKLKNFSPDQLSYLLDSRKLLLYSPSKNKHVFDSGLMGNVTDWNPRISYEFLSTLGMIKTTQSNTVYKLTDWMRAHLIHISGSDTYLDLYGYAGPPLVDKIAYPLSGKKHITAGCWGTSGLYAALLRSVNIPVKHGRSLLNGGNHSRPEFISIDSNLIHGDDPYNVQLLPSGSAPPSSELFLTNAEISSWIDSPALDCKPDMSKCNTTGEQASYNSSRERLLIGKAYLPDYFLQLACTDKPYLQESLIGNHVGGELKTYIKPFLTPIEQQDFLNAVDNKLKSIGGGDWNKGCEIAKKRWAQFGVNR